MTRNQIPPLLGVVAALFISELVWNAVAIDLPLRWTNLGDLAYVLLLSFPIVILAFLAINVFSRFAVARMSPGKGDLKAFTLTLVLIASLGFLVEFLEVLRMDGTAVAGKAAIKSALISLGVAFVPALIANFVKPALEIRGPGGVSLRRSAK